MKAHPTESEAISKNIAAAMAMGFVFKLGIHFNGNMDTISVPLLKEAAILRDFSVLLILKALLLVLYWRKGYNTVLFLIGAFTTVLVFLASYSSMAAFIPQLALNCLLMAIVVRSSPTEQQNRQIAILFTSTIFIVAALQKMNSTYLSGVEFESRAGFAVYYLNYLEPLPFWLTRTVLPIGSIATEMALGVGLLFRPKLFANLTVLFVITLMFVHPALSLPYLTFAATCCLIDSQFSMFLKHLARKLPIQSPFFWLLVALIFHGATRLESKLQFGFPLISICIAIALLAIHMFYILKADLKNEWFKESLPFPKGALFFQSKQNLSGILLVVLMCASPIFFHFGAPAPIGFSMFSGQTTKLNRGRALRMPSLKIDDRQVCEILNRRLARTVVVDVSFFQSDAGCRLIAPTRSGLRYIREKICVKSPATCSHVYFDR